MRFPDLLAVRQRGRLTSKRMLRVDPWEKAADCERAIQAAADPQQKTILKNLRYLWIALANESECMSAVEFRIAMLHSSKMLRPSTVTASDSGLRRAPSHTGHGTSRM